MITEDLKKPEVGHMIWFAGEKRPYTVQACDDRFIICTKPMAVVRSVLYTIIDLQQNIRGRENMIFCMGFETRELCEEALVRLQNGLSEVSHRHRVELEIIRITDKKFRGTCQEFADLIEKEIRNTGDIEDEVTNDADIESAAWNIMAMLSRRKLIKVKEKKGK